MKKKEKTFKTVNAVLILPPNKDITTTSTVDDIRKACQNVGDNLKTTYDRTGDLKAAQACVSAYGTAIAAVKAQLIYKKMTGSPGKIDFFETEKS